MPAAVRRRPAPEPSAAPLDLHEGNDPRGCPRWPAGLRLESTLGDLVPGRCHATNLCAYCARLAAVETAEVLAIDAMRNEAPGVYAVLTTRTATLDLAGFQNGLRAARRALRREWPSARSAQLVEFQTGRGRNSGGERRPHWNWLLKGVPSDVVDQVHDVIASAWCARVDAEPEAQWVGAIAEAGGLMRYLALHFQKSDQAPPQGWRGHRFRAQRGYLEQPMAQAREEARQALRFKREVWRAHQAGLRGAEAEEAAHQAMYEASELAWSLVRLQQLPTTFGPDGLPATWEEVVVPV